MPYHNFYQFWFWFWFSFTKFLSFFIKSEKNLQCVFESDNVNNIQVKLSNLNISKILNSTNNNTNNHQTVNYCNQTFDYFLSNFRLLNNNNSNFVNNYINIDIDNKPIAIKKMANTWNKIKKKLTFKKKGRGSNRRRNGRGKNRNRNSSNSSNNNYHHNLTPNTVNRNRNNPITPKAAQQHHNSITTLPNKTSKRRSSRSNIFGCLTSVPQERENYNVQPQERRNHNIEEEGYHYNETEVISQKMNNKINNMDTNKNNQPQIINKSSDEMKGESHSSNINKSAQGLPAAEQLRPHDIGKSVSPETKINEIKFNRARIVNVPKPRPPSPSKSKTSSTYFTGTTFTDIQDNISMINEIESSPKHRPDRDSYNNNDNNKLLATPQNENVISTKTILSTTKKERGHIHDSEMKYNGYRDHYDGCYGTPTPQTHNTGISNISYASSSELCPNGNTSNISDIYDGVIEVENDKIIEEGDMSNYYSVDHDDDAISVQHEQEPTDEDEDDDDDDINHSSTNYSGQKERGSVIIKSPRDIVDEFSTDHNTHSVELAVGLDHASIDVDIDEDVMTINRDSQNYHIHSIYQGIFREQEYIQELNDELRRKGYDNPEIVLQELWDEQIEIERGAQILKILKYFCQKV